MAPRPRRFRKLHWIIAFVAVAGVVLVGVGGYMAYRIANSVQWVEPPRHTLAREREQVQLDLHLSPSQWWDRELRNLPEPPSPLKNRTIEELERLHRKIDVDRFNRAGQRGRRYGTRYQELADEMGVEFADLVAADRYVHERVEFVADALRRLLARDPDISPDIWAPVRETAYLGTYTAYAEIVVDGCPDDPQTIERAEAAATRFIAYVGPMCTGFKVPTVGYRCAATNKTARLDLGFLWDRKTNELQQLGPCSSLQMRAKAQDAEDWCVDEWNDGKPVER